MGLNRRPLFPGALTKQFDAKEKVAFQHTIVTSTSGAISTQTSQKFSGMTAALHGSTAGKYTFTLDGAFAELSGLAVAVKGANATYANTAGRDWFLLPTTDVTASPPIIDLQFVRNSDGAVAQVENGATIIVSGILSRESRS